MATIVLPAEKVILATKAIMARVETAREGDNARIIALAIKDLTPGRIDRLLGKVDPTEKQAIAHLNEINDFCGWRSLRYHAAYEHAKKLLKLAQLGDLVTLNEGDATVLF